MIAPATIRSDFYQPTGNAVYCRDDNNDMTHFATLKAPVLNNTDFVVEA